MVVDGPETLKDHTAEGSTGSSQLPAGGTTSPGDAIIESKWDMNGPRSGGALFKVINWVNSACVIPFVAAPTGWESGCHVVVPSAG